MKELEQIVALSHELGGPDYVKGGGGNCSFKQDGMMWVKPSGTTLSGLTVDQLVPVDRNAVAEIYAFTPPDHADRREQMVGWMLEKAVTGGHKGRPSVETPLHDSFEAPYVLHTHPPLLNGMLCGKDAETACRDLFPEALWIEYIDPGYTLCMHVREQIERYRVENGREPSVIMLRNHGVFVAGSDNDEIRTIYADLMAAMKAGYATADIPIELAIDEAAPSDMIVQQFQESCRTWLDKEGASLVFSGRHEVPHGPLTPDHIVYAKAVPMEAPPTREHVENYRAENGYFPRVMKVEGYVFGIGANERMAGLAADLARDGALVEQLAPAFGGVQYMSKEARAFIENWEVESYRQNVASKQESAS